MRDTHQTKFNKDIELVQRKATRYYIRPVGYSSGIPATRSWLQDQEQPSGDATSYLLHIWREKKNGWPYNQIDQSNKGSLQQLFFPRSIRDWKQLPDTVSAAHETLIVNFLFPNCKKRVISCVLYIKVHSL